MGIKDKFDEKFNETWISPGTMVLEKDSLQNHINSVPHKQAVKFDIKKTLGLLLTLKKSSTKNAD